MVAQVDEQQPAMVAHPVHPAAQPDIIAHIARRKGCTGVGTIAVHFLDSSGGAVG
jgi:hypothetical protein